MIKILIFSGGTGSIALQTGLYDLYGDAVRTDIIISAYDNGKSTGVCRRVFNGKILGPSDLRKNQLTRFKLTYDIGKGTATEDKVLLYELFNERFSKESWEEAYTYVIQKIDQTFDKMAECGFVSAENDYKRDTLRRLTNQFFFTSLTETKREVRETVEGLSFTDFSISNLFYAAAAAANGNSLGLAGKLMAGILEIPDCVHLISDRNLYLHAQTRSGHTITDEGEIVVWDHPEDSIVDISLHDELGNEYIPHMDEGNRTDTTCRKLIDEADIIVFSSGTQWSSLIPTYAHTGLREALEKCSAKKYLVMNNVEDRDMKGVGAAELLDIVNRYISLSKVSIVLNTCAHERMNSLPSSSTYRVLRGELGEKSSHKHDPVKLAAIILRDYFADYLEARYYFFDFDDTVWSSSKDEFCRKYSRLNLKAVYQGFAGKSIFISGNSASHFSSLGQKFRDAAKAAGKPDVCMDIYCNGGNCHYYMKDGCLLPRRTLCSDFNLDKDFSLLSEKIREALENGGWNMEGLNFENRGDCILSIKPLQNRENAKQVIDDTILRMFHTPKYIAQVNGNTTIDIMDSRYDKRMCAGTVCRELGFAPGEVVCAGDSTERGNDFHLTKAGFKVLAVRDIFDFHCFAMTYITTVKP